VLNGRPGTNVLIWRNPPAGRAPPIAAIRPARAALPGTLYTHVL
jgi:hypothetical protein